MIAFATFLALGACLGLDAIVIEPEWIRVTWTRIPIQGLDPALEGTRIALLADMHHGPWTGAGFVRRAALVARAERPDIVALAGDFVHHGAKYAEPGIAPLALIDPPLGTYAVLGNHDHWEGADEVRTALRAHGITLLENSNRIVEKGGTRLALAGLEEIWEGAPDVGAALRGVPPEVPRILIAHNPDAVDILGDEPAVDLVLAGHTHGGQVVLPFLGPLLVPARKDRASGLFRTDHTLVYVTAGLGEITPPVRFLCRPEIAMLVLVRAHH